MLPIRALGDKLFALALTLARPLVQDDQPTTSKPQLEFKEIAVLIPLIGSAIAISYDVGYFYGIDIRLFTLFSLAEHILFAFSAAPVALVLTILLTAYFGPRIDVAVGLKIAATAETMKKKTKRSIDTLLVVLVIAAVGAVIYFRYFALGASFLVGAALALFRFLPISKKVIYLISCVLVIITAFAIGHDFARFYVIDGPANHSIQFENETLAVKLIRSGDRGISILRAQSQAAEFCEMGRCKEVEQHLVTAPHIGIDDPGPQRASTMDCSGGTNGEGRPGWTK